jgi:uncharacterized OB-fold protein
MEVSRHWRLKAQRYRLEGLVCPACGQPSFPPRPVCPNCLGQPARIKDYKLPTFATLTRISNSKIVEKMIG